MEINAETVDEVRHQLKSSFNELVADARDEYERMADLQDIDTRLSNVIEQEIRQKIPCGTLPPDFRATVHVRDIIFRDFLYQLVDYLPKGGGSHRRFSQRYGIIGRSWRSGNSHGTGDAFAGASSEGALVEQWGMTKEEAHGMLNSKHSCLSIVLRSNNIPVGLLYLDADDRDVFGNDAAAMSLAADLESQPAVVELAEAVERAMAPLRAAAPNLDLKELGA